ncbi:MAG: hypothetical protein ACFFAO_17755 [Candidatus Hermodarchaeota archaeon]
MKNHIEALELKINNLERLSYELETRITKYKKNTDQNWLSTLETCRAEIDAFREGLEVLFKIDEELTQTEHYIYETGSFKKIQKFEKKKKKLSDDISSLGKIFEIFENNLRVTISKL